jgi:lysophospholipase L1-like esterase
MCHPSLILAGLVAALLPPCLSAADAPASSSKPAAPAVKPPDPPLPSVTPRRPGVPRIVCFGDSITGFRPGLSQLDKTLRWPDLLQLALDLQYGDGMAEVLGMGYAGDRTYQSGWCPGAVNRVQSNILDYQPDIAIILIGGNNFRVEEGTATESIRARLKEDLTAIVTKVRQAGIKVLLLQYPEPKAANPGEVWWTLDDGNPVTAAVAKEAGIPTLELAPVFAAAAKTHPLETLLNPVDGVHFQPYGDVVTARAVFRKLRELGWLASTPKQPG